ncbi:J domain-containing protein [Deltaproteobacteria bacterium TL4]
MDFDTALKVLEVEQNATIEEIRENFRDLLHIWHPDRHAGHPRRLAKAEEKTREINAAYEKIVSKLATKPNKNDVVSKDTQNPVASKAREPSIDEDLFFEAVLKSCLRHQNHWFKKGFDLNWHIQHRSSKLEKYFWDNMNHSAKEFYRQFGGKDWEKLAPFFVQHIKALETRRQCTLSIAELKSRPNINDTKQPTIPFGFKLRNQDKWLANELQAYCMMMRVLFDHHLEILTDDQRTMSFLLSSSFKGL